MAGTVSTKRRRRTKSRNRKSLQKPTGVISPRVAKVGGERFAIVCIDPAKNRSEWMMADYFGNVIIPPRTVEHQSGFFKMAFALVREAREKHGIQDLIVTVERTGNYFLIPKRAFAKAGFETRVIHPFATKQYRMPANPGNKTDETDLHAQHRAAVAGFGLRDLELESPYRELQVRVRHRRSLIEKATAIACQGKEHLHLSLPGYSALFDHLYEHQAALAISRSCESPAEVLEFGAARACETCCVNSRCGIRFGAIDKDSCLGVIKLKVDSIQDGSITSRRFGRILEQLYQTMGSVNVRSK